MSLAKALAKSARQHKKRTEPLWAGPCADGPNGGVTQSLIARWLCCRERFRVRYIEGLQPVKRWEPKSGFGDMWHVCEEAAASEVKHFDGELKGTDTTLWFDRLQEHVRTISRLYPTQQEDIAKWYAVCRTQFPVYVEYWSKHPDVMARTPLLQEQSFDVPYKLPSGRVVRLRGKWDSVDLVGKGKEASIWLQENKTKSKINEQQLKRQLTFDLQTMLYLIALQTELDEPTMPIPVGSAKLIGVRYNVIKRDCPVVQHKDRQLKKGFVRGETVEEWCERLRADYFAANPEEWFFRWNVKVSAADALKFKRECLDPVLENICDDHEWWLFCYRSNGRHSAFDINAGTNGVDERSKFDHHVSRHFRMPYGVYNVLAEGGIDDLDAYLADGSEVGLTRERGIFEELT